MKIGILTLPLHTNYGGILQAYALQKVLIRMGHEVILIDGGIHRLPIWRIIASSIKRFVVSLGKNSNQLFSSFYIRKFVRKNVYFLPKDEFVEENTFDAIIVGSDQVWRSLYTKDIEYYYLDFAKEWKNKKIAYAVSFGVDYWDYSMEKTELCRQLASNFDYISVREESGIDLCKNYLNVDAAMMIDPTLLLSANEYKSIAAKNRTKVSKGILAYILDETIEKNEVLINLSKTIRMEYHLLNKLTSFMKQYLPIEYWVDSFANAQYVFTDSFHGCVFSIIFNVPFVVYGNKERGMTRFYSLLKMFGLEGRLIHSIDEFSKAIDTPIDWEQVNENLQKHQILAKNTLEECLKN